MVLSSSPILEVVTADFALLAIGENSIGFVFKVQVGQQGSANIIVPLWYLIDDLNFNYALGFPLRGIPPILCSICKRQTGR